MGMAAGQARLLSITSRMSDNELRAQIINNNKMRLATQSSQVSESYVQALNEAQMMFTNYDKDNNASYKQLTFNALTAYNPYNNQYGLVNSSGQLLVSETDAKNYNASSSLEDFLGCYGLEYKTTYFDNLKTADGVAAGTSQEVYFASVDADGKIVYNQGTGFTAEGLEALYYGKGTVTFANGTTLSDKGSEVTDKLESYDTTLQTQGYYDYFHALENFNNAEETYLGFVAEIIDEKLKTTLDGKTISSYISGITGSKDVEGVKNVLSTIKNTWPLSSDGKNIINDLTEMIPTYSNNRYVLNTNINFGETDQNTGETYQLLRSGNRYYIGILDSNNNISEIVCSLKNDGSLYQFWQEGTENPEDPDKTTPGQAVNASDASLNGISMTWDKTNIDLITSTKPTNRTVTYPAGTTDQAFGIDEFEIMEFTNTPKPIATLSESIEEEDIKGVLETILRTLQSSVYNIVDLTDPKVLAEGLSGDPITRFTNAYNAYCKAAVQLGNAIYGNGKYSCTEPATGFANLKHDPSYPDIQYLTDISALYNKQDESGKVICTADFGTNITDSAGTSYNFFNIYKNILLDNVMNTYGEPQFAWIDKNDSNANGEAKKDWYTNLYERMKQGYQTLTNGLASSPEWIKFALESSLVTMEQVDVNKKWQSTMYSNCSDITEQTNDAMATKAEAEYKAAMNKIENKDKRYDLELKNIDTEHNSLQTEYDSIKTAIDKNIERTFKLYS